MAFPTNTRTTSSALAALILAASIGALPILVALLASTAQVAK